MPSLTDLPTPPDSQRKRKSNLPLDVPDDDPDEFIDIYELLARAGDIPQNRSSPTVRETRKDAEVVYLRREYDRFSPTSERGKNRVRFQNEGSAEIFLPESKATQLLRHSCDSSPKRESDKMALSSDSADKLPTLQAIISPVSELADATDSRAYDLPVTGKTLRNIQATYAEKKRQNDELFKLALSERWHKDRRQDIKASRDKISETLRAIKTMTRMWEEHQCLLTQRRKLADEVASLYARNLDTEKGEAELDSFAQIESHGEKYLHAISAAGLDKVCLPSGNATAAVDNAAPSKSVSMQDQCQTGDSKGAETRRSCWKSDFVTAKAVLQGQPNGHGKCK